LLKGLSYLSSFEVIKRRITPNTVAVMAVASKGTWFAGIFETIEMIELNQARIASLQANAIMNPMAAVTAMRI